MADDLAARAASLTDRLAAASTRRPEAPLTDVDHDRTQRWRAAAARGDDAVLRNRISAWTSLDPADLVAALGRAQVSPLDPDWLQILRAIDPADTLGSGPLAGLTSPLVARAWRRVDDPSGLLSPRAVGDARGHLTDRLTRLIQTTIDTLYQGARAEGMGWQGFEEGLVAEGLQPLWQERPALARLVGRTMINWADTTNDLLAHLAADRVAVASLLDVSEVRGIDSLAPGRSDPHRGGRSVTVVTASTDQGLRQVVYKPKSLAAEAFFSDVLAWVDGRGLDLGPPLRVIDRGDHGWAEYVLRADTQDPRTYYHRTGILTAVLFALGGNDCHAENLVARGNQPVVIDAETVLQPQLRPETGREQIDDDVLDLLMLPRWLRVGGRALDLSASGAAGSGVAWERRILRWQHPGTDDARLVPVRQDSDLSSAAAMSDGRLWHPQDFAADILDGFIDAWALLADSGADLLDGPLSDLGTVPVRVLARMTRTYSRISDTSLNPGLLRDGLDRSIHLEHLARYVMDRDDWAATLPLIDAERDQMEDGDIPMFTVTGAATSLTDESGAELVAFTESAQGRALRRLRSLGPAERATQEDLVRTSLALAPRGVRSQLLAGYPHRSDRPGPMDHQTVAAAADRLLGRVMHQTGSAPKGLVAVSPDQWGIEHHTTGWYDGLTGIVVGLAGAARALGDEAAAERARDLLAMDLAEADSHGTRLWRGRGVGGQDGVGGIVLGWSLAAGLMPDTHTAVADTWQRLLTTAHVEQGERGADLLTGVLGLLAGLTGLQEVGIDSPQWLVDETVGLILQATHNYLDGHQVNGFSHGNSGIAVVLAHSRQLGWGPAEEVEQLVHRLLTVESGRFDPIVGDWRDLRVPGRTTPGPGWCNGAPGIAAARVLAGDPDDDLGRLLPLLTDDIQARDNLCCGSSGRGEVLRLLRDAAVPTAEERHCAAVNAMADRVMSDGLRLGVPAASRLQPLGLFQGISGPMYALSAAIDPTLPHALAWGGGPS